MKIPLKCLGWTLLASLVLGGCAAPNTTDPCARAITCDAQGHVIWGPPQPGVGTPRVEIVDRLGRVQYRVRISR
jgi:hypothetical protein